MSSDSLPSFLNLGRSIEIPTVVASFGPILDELAPLPNSLPLDSADSEFQGGACQELIDGLDMVCHSTIISTAHLRHSSGIGSHDV